MILFRLTEPLDTAPLPRYKKSHNKETVKGPMATILLIMLIKGIIIGFAIAAPVGPIGILCIRRTLSGRYAIGLFTGLGAGVADTFYGAVAGFSLATISDFINEYTIYLRLFGGLLL